MDTKKEKIGNLKAQSRDSHIDTLGDSEREKKNEKKETIKGIM